MRRRHRLGLHCLFLSAAVGLLLGVICAASSAASASAARTLGARGNAGGFVLPQAHGQKLLYVSNSSASTVLGFALNVNNPGAVEEITSGIDVPTKLWTVANGDLYVANAGNNSVSAYHPGQLTPFLTLLSGVPQQPQAVAVDASGTVYISNNQTAWSPSCNCDNQIAEYANGSTSPTLVIFEPGPLGMAFDASNNLFVADAYGGYTGDFIYVYPPGATSPLPNFYTGMQHPDSVTFAKGGDFFVADQGYSSIYKFLPSQANPVPELVGVNAPEQIAWADGKLYVAEYKNNIVAAYVKTKGGLALKYTYSSSISTPIGVAVSPVRVP